MPPKKPQHLDDMIPQCGQINPFTTTLIYLRYYTLYKSNTPEKHYLT